MKKLWIATCILMVSNVFVGCGGGGSSSKDDNSSADGSKNHAPVAKDTNVTINKNSSTNIAISSIASDADGYSDIVSKVVVSPTTHGTAVVNGDNIVYTPAKDYSGKDTVNYTVTDKGGLSDSGIITITINSQGNPPPNNGNNNNVPIAMDSKVYNAPKI